MRTLGLMIIALLLIVTANAETINVITTKQLDLDNGYILNFTVQNYTTPYTLIISNNAILYNLTVVHYIDLLFDDYNTLDNISSTKSGIVDIVNDTVLYIHDTATLTSVTVRTNYRVRFNNTKITFIFKGEHGGAETGIGLASDVITTDISGAECEYILIYQMLGYNAKLRMKNETIEKTYNIGRKIVDSQFHNITLVIFHGNITIIIDNVTCGTYETIDFSTQDMYIIVYYHIGNMAAHYVNLYVDKTIVDKSCYSYYLDNNSLFNNTSMLEIKYDNPSLYIGNNNIASISNATHVSSTENITIYYVVFDTTTPPDATATPTTTSAANTSVTVIADASNTVRSVSTGILLGIFLLSILIMLALAFTRKR